MPPSYFALTVVGAGAGLVLFSGSIDRGRWATIALGAMNINISTSNLISILLDIEH
jgi:hypothetical protein